MDLPTFSYIDSVLALNQIAKHIEKSDEIG